jgi:hypothetical protein
VEKCQTLSLLWTPVTRLSRIEGKSLICHEQLTSHGENSDENVAEFQRCLKSISNLFFLQGGYTQ